MDKIYILVAKMCNDTRCGSLISEDIHLDIYSCYSRLEEVKEELIDILHMVDFIGCI